MSLPVIFDANIEKYPTIDILISNLDFQWWSFEIEYVLDIEECSR